MGLFGTNVIGSTKQILSTSNINSKKFNEKKSDITINFGQMEQTPFEKISNAQLKHDEAEITLNEAKGKTVEAQKNMTSADNNVKNAETALAEAKNKKITKTDDKGNKIEEPDKEAISAAEKKLEEAKAKQTEAKNNLKEAQKKEQEAQTDYDNAKKELENAQKEYTQAQQEADNIKNAESEEVNGNTGKKLNISESDSSLKSGLMTYLTTNNNDKTNYSNIEINKKKGLELGEMNSGSMFTGH